ncbi:MAG: hypothetical protein QXD70_05065 [Candidatus Bathyarchaeia archaeon]
MKMTELSPEEERHLLNLSVIPALIATQILLALFVLSIKNQQSLSSLYVLIHFGIPFITILYITTFFSFEILCSRKVKEPLKRHIKRFSGRMVILVFGLSIFIGILITSQYMLLSWIDEWGVLLLTGIIWFGIWIFLMLRFKETFDKLYKGRW